MSTSTGDVLAVDVQRAAGFDVAGRLLGSNG
jgi:hypothetical protein